MNEKIDVTGYVRGYDPTIGPSPAETQVRMEKLQAEMEAMRYSHVYQSAALLDQYRGFNGKLIGYYEDKKIGYDSLLKGLKEISDIFRSMLNAL